MCDSYLLCAVARLLIDLGHQQKLEVLKKATISGRTSTYRLGTYGLGLDRPLVTKGYRDRGKDYVAVADPEPERGSFRLVTNSLGCPLMQCLESDRTVGRGRCLLQLKTQLFRLKVSCRLQVISRTCAKHAAPEPTALLSN